MKRIVAIIFLNLLFVTSSQATDIRDFQIEGISIGDNLIDYMSQKEIINNEETYIPEILFAEHHQSHAAAAFYPSPFEEAVILCMDGVGEWATTSTWIGKGNKIKPLWEISFPHSLGLLYSAFTYYCGFKVNSGEYKLMGLAPYGQPIYAEVIKENLIDIKEDLSLIHI